MSKPILVAIDGSSTADQALQEAIKLSKELQAQLRIAHAVDLINIYFDADFADPSELSNAVTTSGQKILRKAETMVKRAGLPVETRQTSSAYAHMAAVD